MTGQTTKYRGVEITRSDVTTDGRNGRPVRLYALTGYVGQMDFTKPAAKRPFLTSVRAAREEIAFRLDVKNSHR